MLAFKPERRPQADIWGARVWVLAERGGTSVSGCAVPPPHEQAPEWSFPNKSHPCAPEEEGTPPGRKRSPHFSIYTRLFLGGVEGKKNKKHISSPRSLSADGEGCTQPGGFFGGWICLDPRFWGAFRSSSLFCWMLAASEG